MKNSILKACLPVFFTFLFTDAFAIKALISNAVFYMPDSAISGNYQPYVETSWQITPHTLHFRTTQEKKLVASYKTEIIYYTKDSVISKNQFISQTKPYGSIGEINAHNITDLTRCYLPEGNIKMKLQFIDLSDSANVFTYTDSFIIKTTEKKPFISNIQILDTFYESHSQTMFSKNEQEQIPLNGAFLDDNKRTINYYFELYGSETVSKKQLPLVLKVFLSKTEGGSSFQFFYKKDTLVPSPILPVVGTFNIASLVSGNYYLNATLEDAKHFNIAGSSFFFQRLNKHPAKEDSMRKFAADTGLEKVNLLDLDKTFIAKYDLAQIKSILKMILPISDPTGTQTIKSFLDKPDEMYMRYYIYNFFLSQNAKNPGKAWKEYSDKVIEVNKLFKTAGTPGYETERGVIYLKYGTPTEIINVENEQGTLPYEIWQYNILAQSADKSLANGVFLFYKPHQGAADFVLLHTNVGGEPQNPNWRNFLYLNAGKSSVSNSRAEQYFGAPR